MNKNSTRFQLAYILPVFYKNILDCIRMYGLALEAQQLIQNSLDLPIANEEVLSFLYLFHKVSFTQINMEIDWQHWNNYWKQSYKKTALSLLGIYFRHYKAQSSNVTFTAIRCLIINVSIKNKTPLQS